MSFTVYIRRAAELDVAEAQVWYEKQQIGLAAKFHHELSSVLAQLAETPLIYPIVYRNVRRAVLHCFPFLVWYRVEDSVVTVLACTHGKANPSKIRRRLR
ncbi:MAG: type II toxin-antitoxin system RelE/ParE family toxin [Methylobacter sp.]|nr:type II toxin-antitoxin system RelE/ParE family toxin [Methylobacter sp.]